MFVIIMSQANPLCPGVGGQRSSHDRPGFIALELLMLSAVPATSQFYQLRVTHGSVNTVMEPDMLSSSVAPSE